MGGRCSARIAVVGAALAVGAPLAAGDSDAATFGADLTRAPTNEYVCGTNIPPLGFYPGAGSCMYFSSSPSPYAPVSGTVTAVRVRVGPHTGPMQVVVMRSLYQNHAGEPGHPYFACCFVEGYGPIFEPQPNTVTTVPTSLPMTEEPTPLPEDFTTNAAGDFLALSVLAPNVPIPIAIDNSTRVSGFYPAPTAQTVTAPPPNPMFETTSLSAGQVLLSADLTPAAGAPAGGAPAAGGGQGALPPAAGGGARVPAVNLPRTIVPVAGNTANVPLQCQVLDCRGNIALQSAPLGGLAAAAAVAKVKRLTYGTASFSLKAGSTRRVKVKLSTTGRRLLRSHRTTTVWANITFSSGGGTARSFRVTLKR
jgi:hypothetical protein